MLTFKQKVKVSSFVSNIVGNLSRESGTRILMYHSIGYAVDGDSYGIYSIDKSNFCTQMNQIAEMSGVNVVALGDCIGNSSDVVITFDDGFRDTYEDAVPILLDFKFPFTVFISPRLIESNDKRYLDRKTLLELSKIKNCNIGAHGYSHCHLTECSDKKLQNELEDSKAWLEDLLSIPVNTMSYPHGAVDLRVRDAVQSAGYSIAASSQPGANLDTVDRLKLSRTDIWSIDDAKIFEQKMNGSWDWMRWFV